MQIQGDLVGVDDELGVGDAELNGKVHQDLFQFYSLYQ